MAEMNMICIPEKRTAPEYLDLPQDAYALEELEDSLTDIRIINRYLGDLRAVFKHLSPLIGDNTAFTLLDVATGSADIPVAISEWSRKKGVSADITAVDINPQTIEIARKHASSHPEIKLQVADGLALPFPDRSFDIVMCSKTAHHLKNEEVVRLVTEMLRVAKRGYLLMDLRRSWIAYFLICLLTRLFTRNRLTRNDGPLSVLKSFTADELAAIATSAGATSFSVSREPFWLLVLAGEVR
jgi:2-polyprenyl-3-methyl-5-hydroxy-6-metoxy-1,4-benzoquinol methylase